MNKPFHKMTDAEKTVVRITQNRVIAKNVIQRGALPAPSKGKAKVRFMGVKAVGFALPEVFPLIASVITNLCGENNHFVGHREIVYGMLQSVELRFLLDQIVAKDSEKRPRNWWANSMMSWFSQKYTTEANPYVDTFERDSEAEPYKYRVRSGRFISNRSVDQQ
jgi:hypothetical protein